MSRRIIRTALPAALLLFVTACRNEEPAEKDPAVPTTLPAPLTQPSTGPTVEHTGDEPDWQAGAEDEGPTLPAAGRAGARSPVTRVLREPRPLDILKVTPLYEFNEREVDLYLRHLRRGEPDPVKRLVHLARKNIGQPYQLYLLGEFPYETHDPDPMYCLSKSDCVTFAEHSYAMALAGDWRTFFQILQRLRYKDGRVGMLTRNHETLCDWDRNNAWLFEDLTRSLGPGRQWVPMTVVWRPARFFEPFGIGQDLPDVKLEDAYIPRRNMARILGELKDGDFVNVIRGNRGGEWCGHVGLVVRGPGGKVNLIHATQPAVREQPLLDYLARNPAVRGFKFLRLRPGSERTVARMLAGEGP